MGAEEVPSVLPWRGEKIPSYSLHSLSAKLGADQWSATLYIDNLTDEYAITGTRVSRRLIEQFRGTVNGLPLRNYGHYIGRPRTAGVSFTYLF